MATHPPAIMGSKHLASILEQRIASGAYVAGEPFMTVREVARTYGVSTMTAHRGIRELAKRDVLAVRPRSGVEIGSAVRGITVNACVKTAHFIIPHDHLARQRFLYEGLQEGVLESLPGISVQLNMLPEHGAIDYLRRLSGLGEASEPNLFGVILLQADRIVKEFFANRSLPAVAIGHVDGDLDLPFVDRDQSAMGRTIGTYLLDKGHDRLGLVMRERWRPGDNLLLDGLQAIMAERSMNIDRLAVVSVAEKLSAMQSALRALMARDNRPSALICREHMQALTCLEVAKEMRLRVPEDLALVCLGTNEHRLQNADPPITSMACDGYELGRRAGELLAKLSEGKRLDHRRIELQSTLIERRST